MTETTTSKSTHLLRLQEVLKRVPVSRSAWYEGIKTGRFPKPTMLGPRTPAWSDATIEALIHDLAAAE